MRKITIIGAGAVGATTAYALSRSSLVDEICIIDINNDRAWGTAWDIKHGVALYDNVNVYNGSYEDSKNSDITIITVGVPEVVGESRLIPLRKNAEIMKNILPEIVKYSPNGKILVVSNPVDIMTYLALKYSGLDKSKVIGLGTVLDTARLKCFLSDMFKVDGQSIQGFVLGEHGDSQVSAWSLTHIAGIPIKEYAQLINYKLEENFGDEIEKAVKKSAFDVWEKKGPNCYCVADAITEVVKAILRNENKILSVSSLLNGEYGINDVCISIPTIINENGVSRTLEVNLLENEKQKLIKSANMLKELIAEI